MLHSIFHFKFLIKVVMCVHMFFNGNSEFINELTKFTIKKKRHERQKATYNRTYTPTHTFCLFNYLHISEKKKRSPAYFCIEIIWSFNQLLLAHVHCTVFSFCALLHFEFSWRDFLQVFTNTCLSFPTFYARPNRGNGIVMTHFDVIWPVWVRFFPATRQFKCTAPNQRLSLLEFEP
jgi:hypothetical protein